MQILERIIRRLGFSSAFLVNGVASLFVTKILATSLPLETYGAYSISIAAAAVLNALALQWLRLLVLRKSIESSEEYDSTRGAVLVIYVGILSSLLVIGAAGWGFVGVSVVVLAGLQGGYEIALSEWRGKGDVRNFVSANALRAFLWLAIATSITLFAPYSTCLVFGLSLSFLISIVVYYIPDALHGVDRGGLAGRALVRIFPEIRRVFLSAWPLIIASASSMLVVYILKYSVAQLINSAAMGECAMIFDMLSLAVMTPMLALNYQYQTRVFESLRLGREGCPAPLKRFQLLLFAFAAAAVFIAGIAGKQIFGYVAKRELQHIDAAGFGMWCIAVVSLGVKQYWVDQYFYLTERYSTMAIVGGVSLLIFFAALCGLSVLPGVGVNDICLAFFSCTTISNMLGMFSGGRKSPFFSAAACSTICLLLPGVFGVLYFFSGSPR